MMELKTKIGLEIHVQLATKSKMFCRCDNEAQGKTPNTVVCPVCLGLPGALPVANRQAIEWTIKTGLALNCAIPKIAKFDRKHYFYPDLPKGYQISQYDEPFCVGGEVEVGNGVISSEVERSLNKISPPTSSSRNDKKIIRLNRIHLEEDAGKLIHSGNKSLVDLNRAGTPLMEIVTEPDITSPEMAGAFLRKLQKIVRDVVAVSEASMEKGHLRCDANISVTEERGTGNGETTMSPIIELKNLNSFKFVEKALKLVEEKLNHDHADWPSKPTKETWGYNSENNTIYLQRRKEEAADYRYFPEPDLPPVLSSAFDLEKLKSETGQHEEEKIESLKELGVPDPEAKVLAADPIKWSFLKLIISSLAGDAKVAAAKAIVHNYFGFNISKDDEAKGTSYAKIIAALAENEIQKADFATLAGRIRSGEISFDQIEKEFSAISATTEDINMIIQKIIDQNPAEAARYKAGEGRLLGFFMGAVLKEVKGANPAEISKILKEKLS